MSIPANVVWKSQAQSVLKNIGEIKENKQLEAHLHKLVKYVESEGSLEDCYETVIQLLRATIFEQFEGDVPPDPSVVVHYPEVDDLLYAILSSPMFKAREAKRYFTESVMRSILRVFQHHCSIPPKSENIAKKNKWKLILYKTYSNFYEHRPYLYGKILDYLHHLVRVSKDPKIETLQLKIVLNKNKEQRATKHQVLSGFYSLSEMLEVVAAIIQGFDTPLKQQHVEGLLKQCLLPLHTNPIMKHELEAALSIYHQQISFCLVEFCKKDAQLTKSSCVRLFSDIQTLLKQGNTKPAVLLINECEQLLEILNPEEFPQISKAFFSVVVSCLENFNFFIAQRCLLLMRVPHILSLLYHNSIISVFEHEIVPKIYHCAQEHWNDTTRQMSYQLLDAARQHPSSAISKSIAWQTIHAAFTQRFAEEEEQEKLKEIRMLQPKPDLNFLSLVFVKKLGEGSYSQVHHVRRIDNKVCQLYWEDYALKIMDKKLLIEQHYLQQARNEIRLLSSVLCNHPNIIKFISKFSENNKIYLVLEFAERGDLFNVLERLGSVDNNYALYVASQLCNALHFIHSKGFVHLDIKPENILITKYGHLKISDFASSISYRHHHQDYKLQGTAEYISPSLIKGNQPSPSDDVWALGCLIFQLLAGFTPFNADEKEKLFKDISERKLIFPVTFPPLAKQLVQFILCTEQVEYVPVSLEQVMAHPFFEGVDWKNVAKAEPLKPSEGSVKVADIDMNLRQRKYSMMLTSALPKKYQFSSFKLDPIPESPQEEEDDQ